MSKAALIGVLVIITASSGCSKLVPKLDEVIPDNRKNYQKAQSLPDLEVPPELSSDAIRDRMAIPEGGTSARFSTYQERRADSKRAAELEKAQTSAIRVLENEHVLAVDGAPVQVWPKLRAFWESQGYQLELDDVELGIIETSWSEDEAKLSRDKYKVFAEAGEQSGTTVLYISHEGQELVPQGQDLVWQRRPRNVELERGAVEKLEQSLLGAPVARTAASAGSAEESETVAVAPMSRENVTREPARSTTGGPQRAELVSVGDGKVYLTVAEDFPAAWKAVGRALEQAGVMVKNADKGRGIYDIELTAGGTGEQDEDGMFSKLKFWGRGKSAEYQVSLTGVGEKTEVVILDRAGRWETSGDATTLLNTLHANLNDGRS
jgi:outer membrane protein assembly factor BamC